MCTVSLEGVEMSNLNVEFLSDHEFAAPAHEVQLFPLLLHVYFMASEKMCVFSHSKIA
jgi:hypothetical protein